MKNSVWLLMALLTSICFADIHSGLKSAIDAGNIKQAKNLVEKMGVRDIYCPSSLKLSDAKKIYSKAFKEHPLFFWDHSYSNVSFDSTFLDDYIAQSCTGKEDTDIKVCDAWMKQTTKKDWDQFEKNFCQNKEGIELCKRFLDSTSVDSLMPYFKRLEAKKILEYKEMQDIDTVVAVKMSTKECLTQLDQYYKAQKLVIQDKYERGVSGNVNFIFGICFFGTHAYYQKCLDDLGVFFKNGKKECQSGKLKKNVQKIVKKNITLQPFKNFLQSYFYYMKNLPWYQVNQEWKTQMTFLAKYGFEKTEKDYTNNLKGSYAQSGILPSLEVLQACLLYPKIDKKMKMAFEMDLFDCQSVEKLYNPDCSDKGARAQRKLPSSLGGKDSLIYVCEENRWRIARFDESLGECSASRQGDMLDTTNNVYPHQGMTPMVCDSKEWRKWTKFEKWGGFCRDSIYEKEISIDDTIYICDGKNWRKAIGAESELGICDSSKNLKKVEIEPQDYYGDRKYFYCQNGTWQAIGAFFYKYGSCNDSLEGDVECASEQGCFACVNGNWRDATEEEQLTGKVCDTTRLGTLTQDYRCDENGWNGKNAQEKSLDWCTKEREGETNKSWFGNTYYLCEKTKWRDDKDEEIAKKIAKIRFNNPKATAMDLKAGAVCNKENYGELGDYDMVCAEKGWKKYLYIEKIMGLCNTERQGEVEKFSYDGSYQICDKNEWRRATDVEIEGAKKRR